MDDVAMEQAPMPDSNMLDAGIEDLFGDGGTDLVGADDLGDGLGVALPPAPVPPKLVCRVAEMQWKGCCT